MNGAALSEARFSNPYDVAVGSGVLAPALAEESVVFIADRLNHRICALRRGVDNAEGQVVTVVGDGQPGLGQNHEGVGSLGVVVASRARLLRPECVVPDGLGRLYICDTGASRTEKEGGEEDRG